MSGRQDMTGDDLFGRAAESRLVGSALDQAVGSSSGQLLFFEGPAGIGKSSILAEARCFADKRGFTVAAGRGTDVEEDYAWGLVRQLFEPIVGRYEDIAESTPAAALALSLISTGEVHMMEQQGEYALIHSLLWLTNDLAARAPLVLAVDDVQWSDIPSLRFLAYLAARLDDLPVVIVAASRPGAERISRVISSMIDGPNATFRWLPPLTAEATGRLLTGFLQLDLDEPMIGRCHELTQGNPMWVRELGRQLAVDGRPYTVNEIHLPNLEHYVRLELRRLPVTAQKAMLALAVVADKSTAAWIASVANLSVTEALNGLSALEECGLVTVGGMPASYSVSNPLIKAAVDEGMTLADRAIHHARAAAAALGANQLEKAAGHLLRVPPGISDLDVASILGEAARLCIARGSVDSAIAYLRRQLDEDLGTNFLPVLIALGMTEASVNDKNALEHLSAALSMARIPEQRSQLILVHAMVTWFQVGADDALILMRSALADERDLSIHAQRSLQGLILVFGHMTPTNADFAAELALLPLAADASVGGRLLDAVLGLMQALRNQQEPAVERALRALTDGLNLNAPLADMLLAVAWTTLEAADAPQLSASIEKALAQGRSVGSMRLIVVAHCYRAGLMLSRGNLPDAVSDAQAAWEACRITSPDARLLYIGNYLVQALVACGRYAEARATLVQMRSRSPHLLRFVDGEGELGLLLAEGKVDEALALIDIVRRECAASSIRNPVRCDWRGYLVRCLRLRGRDDEARPIAAENVALAREWGTPRVVGRALRDAATVESPERQVELLRESVDILSRVEAGYELAQSRYALGDSLRRAKNLPEARAQLQAALEIAEHCGAVPLKDDVARALRMAGARPLTAKLGPAALTPGEARVTQLAANGLSNREIAQALFVTVKTVEVHLSNAYRKLGIERRQDLRRVLAG